MANRVFFTCRKFTELEFVGDAVIEIEPTYGYTISDDYDTLFNDVKELDDLKKLTAKDAYNIILEISRDGNGLDIVAQNGFYFNGVWFTPEDNREVFEIDEDEYLS